jgi:hypothetical protein
MMTITFPNEASIPWVYIATDGGPPEGQTVCFYGRLPGRQGAFHGEGTWLNGSPSIPGLPPGTRITHWLAKTTGDVTNYEVSP